MLSAVIPVLNEVDSLAALHRELTDVARDHNYELEIVFVDDGSTDGSWEKIAELATADPRVRGIRFRRNFGKAAALAAGFETARGDVVVTLDADLQDDPREIPRFLAEIDKGLDCISGWKQVRHDPWHKVGPSRVFNWLVGFLTGVKLHDHNCGFKCYRREIFNEVRLYGELHRFVPVLAAARGWKVGEIVVNHRARKFGRSKYGVTRIVKGFLDLLTVYFLTGFEQRPQHLLGTCGIAAFAIGLFGLTYLSIGWLLVNVVGWNEHFPHWKIQPLHERPALLYSVAMLLLGAQFISMGFLAELFTAYYGRANVPYSIKIALDNSPSRQSAVNDTSDTTRRAIYAILIAISTAMMLARIARIDSPDAKSQTPFLSANDRSRWATIRSLGDDGTYAIDHIIFDKKGNRVRGWHTIDLVRHRGLDGQEHYYSSKPTLLTTLLAGEYWIIKQITGATLAAQPHYVSKLMLVLTNVLPMGPALWILANQIDLYGATNWGRIFAVAAACFGTFLTTFSVTLSNHTIAAISLIFALAAALPILADERRDWWRFAAAGLSFAFVAANEIPALSLLVFAGALLAWKSPLRTLLAFLPTVLIVAAAAFLTNYLAHGDWRTPYAHRSPGDNWYDYPGSYWLPQNLRGIDIGEPSSLVYAFNCLIGHHGLFSLTPIWLLSTAGCFMWLIRPNHSPSPHLPTARLLAATTLLTTAVILGFYLTRPQLDRNYGGGTCCLRWLIWLTPLWLLTLLPAADWLSKSRLGRAVAIALLAVSVFSAVYAVDNPWSHPWIFDYWQSMGWTNY